MRRGLRLAGHRRRPTQTALDNIVKTGVIRIAVPTDYPPYGFVGTDLQPQGLDIDMARYVAGKLGVKAELVPVTSTNRVPYLQTRKVDIVISTLARNAEREKVVDFRPLPTRPSSAPCSRPRRWPSRASPISTASRWA